MRDKNLTHNLPDLYFELQDRKYSYCCDSFERLAEHEYCQVEFDGKLNEWKVPFIYWYPDNEEPTLSFNWISYCCFCAEKLNPPEKEISREEAWEIVSTVSHKSAKDFEMEIAGSPGKRYYIDIHGDCQFPKGKYFIKIY